MDAITNEATRNALQDLIRQLESDRSLSHPAHFRERTVALERLEAYDLEAQSPSEQTTTPHPAVSVLYQRARSIYTELEAINLKFYEAIRDEIRRGLRPPPSLQTISMPERSPGAPNTAPGESYDFLDALLTGIFRFTQPAPAKERLTPEMVPYQPTPARHIFGLLAQAHLTERDLFIDLGSGLGHVPLLVAICTAARSVGIELEPAYVHCAQQAAQALNLSSATFLQQDARNADFSQGTVFYFYTPFRGAILRTVLDALCRQSSRREIRVCTFGPCTSTVAAERWLEALETVQPGRIGVFRSKS